MKKINMENTPLLTDQQVLFLLEDLVVKKEFVALEEFCKVIFRNTPVRNPVILNLYSRALFENKKFDEALVILQDCYDNLENEKDKQSIKCNIAKCLYYLKRSHEAIELLDSLPEEKRNSIDTIGDYGLYYNSIGDVEKARECLNRIPNREQYDAASFNEAWFLFREGKFKEGFKNIVRGIKIYVWGNEEELVSRYGITRSRKWIPGEKVNTIAYYLEGGLGDEIVFIRYITLFEKFSDKIKIFAARPLVNFLVQCGYKNVFSHNDIGTEKWDKYVPSMSAPYLLELNGPKEGVSFPYISKTPNRVEEMNLIANGRKKICIKWKGNPEFEHDQFRTFPLEGLLRLNKYGQLFSIQIEDNQDLPKNADVWDMTHCIDSWSDTYDIICESDLLVTSCSSVAHLAAASGQRVIVLVPLIPYVTWASDSTPWYPDNVTVIRQKEYNNWDKAFDELYETVEKILQ